ncbi:thiopurine S-methyltransferase [Thiosulfativibrio zosterae]|uniref:Thiopurine S-methyltransferase n=1 Tax=Thiosulfativibrio zosterae TaxID=2675053 RepID=A0A6F8PPY6_9GAMM|nr:thiopurine S-methyltransferase [Thiosulfativibrio zosterae]BBP44146.1 thiopurine S-methyltransferase [Thiosulfativibrio zosterae]
MQADFWHAMWQSGQVGFHQPDINAFLKDYWPMLGLEGSEEVLVPLCGKTLDMLWLAQQGHDILGVELSQKALDEFLAENQLTAQPVAHHAFCGYELNKMTLLCGDFFDLSPEQCTHIAAVYDRAALVALPSKMRQRYAQHLINILPSHAQILLVNVEYGDDPNMGPPFCVPEAEVFELFGHAFKIEVLAQSLGQRKGMKALEKVFLLKRNS